MRGSQFAVLVCMAQATAMVPVVGLVIHWPALYFHEISHGLAGLLTFGTFDYYEFHPEGGGGCECDGWDPLVSFAGFCGEVLWGLIVFHMALASAPQRRRAAEAFAVMIAASWLLWGTGSETRFVTICLAGAFALVAWKSESENLPMWLGFVAVGIVASPILHTLLLLTVDGGSDAQNLQEMTGVPKAVWVFGWCSLSVVVLHHIWRLTQRRPILVSPFP